LLATKFSSHIGSEPCLTIPLELLVLADDIIE
jgi:hypothetical protein